MIVRKPFEASDRGRSWVALAGRSRGVLAERHRTMAGLVLLCLALALAAVGQKLLNRDKLWAGALMYGASLLPLIWSLRPGTAGQSVEPLAGLTQALQVRRGAARGLGLAAAAGVLAFSVVTYRAFGARTTRSWTPTIT